MPFVTPDAKIEAALMARLSTMMPAYPMAVPNVSYPPAGQTKPDEFIVVQHSPDAVQRRRIGSGEPHQYSGTLVVSLMTPANRSSTPARDLAGGIAAVFPTDARLVWDDVELRITQRPSVNEGYYDNGHGRWRTPIVITYEALT